MRNDYLIRFFVLEIFMFGELITSSLWNFHRYPLHWAIGSRRALKPECLISNVTKRIEQMQATPEFHRKFLMILISTFNSTLDSEQAACIIKRKAMKVIKF